MKKVQMTKKSKSIGILTIKSDGWVNTQNDCQANCLLGNKCLKLKTDTKSKFILITIKSLSNQSNILFFINHANIYVILIFE